MIALIGCEKRVDPVLIEAARDGNQLIVETLLRQGKNVNARDERGWTPLMWSASRGHAEITQVLLEHGAEVNATSQGYVTALMLAAHDGHVVVTEILMKRGADVDAQDKNGTTALLGAAFRGHVASVKVLLEHGADVDHQDQKGDTAMILISKGGYLEELLSRSNNQRILETSREDFLRTAEVLLKYGANLEIQNAENGTALSYARTKNLTFLIPLLEKPSP